VLSSGEDTWDTRKSLGQLSPVIGQVRNLEYKPSESRLVVEHHGPAGFSALVVIDIQKPAPPIRPSTIPIT